MIKVACLQRSSLSDFVVSALVISNHRTRLDWMYLWCFFLRVDGLSALKIVLKVAMRLLW